MSDVVHLTKQLISYPSITPNDAGCQALMIEHLTRLGFEITILPSGKVTNFWAQKGNSQPLFVFAGHTDVVDIGNRDKWLSDPFAAEIRDDKLYGRGAADMKGSLAAMLIACERFYASQPNPRGSLGFMITSGEEGDDFLDGTPIIMQHLVKNNMAIDYCVVGEPSSLDHVGDVIRVGRRGSLSATLVIHGKQGHVAYPNLAENPIHRALAPLHALSHTSWDHGNSYFPPTSFQITQLHVNNTSHNIIPGELYAAFNFRFSPESSVDELKQRVAAEFKKNHLDYELTWILSGNPFLSEHGKLIATTQQVIKKIQGFTAQESTGGGTSDGRFIAPFVKQIIELGPCNATIHQVNECVVAADLDRLAEIYLGLLQELIG